MNCSRIRFSTHRHRVCFAAVLFSTVVVAAPRVDAWVLSAEVVITSGLDRPIYGAAVPGDFDNLYISEQRAARIKRLNLNTLQLTTVLDLPNPEFDPETGLNGFAFHPDFANNGKVYVNWSGNEAGDIRILEYTRSTTDPSVFDVNSEREILTISNPTFSHNGGWIDFGPNDGYLHIGTGDGGNVLPNATKGIQAQDVNSDKGKILRIDVNGDDFPGDESRNYSIPENNPFANGGGAPEVFALGLRHPFRNGFDRETGDLYIGDVGSDLFEEINFLPAGTNGGQNFGWRPLEAFTDHPSWPDPPPPNPVYPIHYYPHGTAAAVIGGYVYRGDSYPGLQGTYVFGDFIQRKLYSFRYDGQLVTALTDRTAELAGPMGSLGGVASFAQDAAGEIYIFDYSRSDIYRIVAINPAASGDYNQDGTVNAADYTVWRNMLGQSGTNHAADGDGDDQIGLGDYNVWKANFGATTLPGGGAASAEVPEPSAVVMVLVGVLAAWQPKRRTNHSVRRPHQTVNRGHGVHARRCDRSAHR